MIEESKSADEMSLKELRELVVSLGLFSVEEASTKRSAGLLKAIHEWEEKAVEENKKNGLRVLGGVKIEETPTIAQIQVEEDMYYGKKVVSRTEREINGKMYEDIQVSTGEIFTNPK